MNLKEQILVALGLDSNVKLEWQAKLTDGTIVVSSAAELDAGVDIAVLTEDGTTMPLPIGEYETEDGVAFRVDEDGIVAEVLVADEEAPEEEVVEEEVEAKQDARLPKKVKESTEVEFNAENFKAELLDEIKTMVVELLTEMKDDNAVLENKVEELSKQPASDKEDISKFKFTKRKKELSRIEYRNLTSKERYHYNLSN